MSPREEAASRQPLWPLFVLASCLSGFGFYEALSAEGQREGVVERWEEVEVDVRVPRGVDSGAGVHRLGYSDEEEREWEYVLAQRVGEGSRETQVGFVAREERGAGEARWEVRGVRVRSRVSGDEVGREVAARLEQALEGSRASGVVSSRGELEVREWEESEDERGDSMRALMGDAMELLRPRLRIGEVRPGDRWSYALGLPGGGAEEGVSVHGEVRVSSTFAGTWVNEGRTYVVIARRFEVEASGGSDQEGDRVRYELSGSGEGLAYLDGEGDEVWKSEVRLGVELRARGEAQAPEVERRELRLRMKRVPPRAVSGE